MTRLTLLWILASNQIYSALIPSPLDTLRLSLAPCLGRALAEKDSLKCISEMIQSETLRSYEGILQLRAVA